MPKKCLCRTSQSYLLAKKFVITQRGSIYTHKVQEFAGSPEGDKHLAGCSPRGDRATTDVCLMASAY